MGWRERRRRRRRPPRSKWWPGYWLRHPLFSLIACCLAALVAALGAFAYAYDTKRLNEHGVAAAATVLEVHGGRSSYVVARFTTADGQTIVADVHDYYWSPVPREGDSAMVIYDPEDPVNVVRDERVGGGYLGAWLFGGVAVFCLVLGGWVVRTWDLWLTLAQDWRAG